MANRFTKAAASIITAVTLLILSSGCAGGGNDGSGNFFDDPPDCYYDYLFGCGTFDIPGNSSYYGYNRAATFRSRSPSRDTFSSIPNFSGQWGGYLDKKSSSCNFNSPQKLQGIFSVKQLNNRVTVKLPIAALKYYPLRGPASKNGFEASNFGFYSFCSFRINSKLSSNNGRSGILEVKVRAKCPTQNSCDFSYQGKVSK